MPRPRKNDLKSRQHGGKAARRRAKRLKEFKEGVDSRFSSETPHSQRPAAMTL
jgi:hypothetical protein